jgi:hypothetical protein
MCYITGWVSPSKDLIAGHKSYISEGNITSIEIWNLTAPEDRTKLKALSWNTRPTRVSLLGTVNFTGIDMQRGVWDLEGHELQHRVLNVSGIQKSRLRLPARHVVWSSIKFSPILPLVSASFRSLHLN